MPRVSDAKVQNIAASCAVNDATVDGDVVLDLALDLRDARAQHAREVADANATILRLQARLDSVRPVVNAAVVMHGVVNAALERGEAPDDDEMAVLLAVDALPADARAWAQEER